MKALKRAALILLAAVTFLSGCSALINDIDLEAVRVPVETRPKNRPAYDKSSEEEADANTRRRSTGIVKYQIPGDSAFYILDANTPSEECILDFDYTGMTETEKGPVLFYAYQALYYSSDETGLGGQEETGVVQKSDTENYLDRRTEKEGDRYYGATGFHLNKENNTWSYVDYIDDFSPYENIDTTKEEYINASKTINTVFMSYCPATREYKVLYHSTEEYQPLVKRLLTSPVAATGSKSGRYVAQIPDFVSHEIINTGANRSYTFYYRGSMMRFNSGGEIISGPTDVTGHLNRLSEREKDDDLYKEMTLLDATMDTEGSIYISVLMEDPNIASKGEDVDEEDLDDEESSSTQWSIIIHAFSILENQEAFDQWLTDPENYHKRAAKDKTYFVAENRNADTQRRNFMRYDGLTIPRDSRPTMQKIPQNDVFNPFTYWEKSTDIALYSDVRTNSRGSVYRTTPLTVDFLERTSYYNEAKRVYVSTGFFADPVFYLVKANKTMMVGMVEGPLIYRPRYTRFTRTYVLYWYEYETDESGRTSRVRREETVTETMDILVDYELHLSQDCRDVYVNQGGFFPWDWYISRDMGTCDMERDAVDTYPFRQGILRVFKAQGDDPKTATRRELWQDYYTGFEEIYGAIGLRNAYAVQGDYNYGGLNALINQQELGVTLFFPERTDKPTNLTVLNKEMNFAVGEGDEYSINLDDLNEMANEEEELKFSTESLLDLHDEQAMCYYREPGSGKWVFYLAGPINGLVKMTNVSWTDKGQVSQVTPCTTYAVRVGNREESEGKLWLIGFNTTEFTYDTANIPCAHVYKLNPYGAQECANSLISFVIRNPEYVKDWSRLEQCVGIDGDWADKLLVNDYKEFLTEGEKNQLLAAKRFYELIDLDWPGDNTNASIPEELLACQYPVDLENLMAKLRPDLNNTTEEVEVTEESYEMREHESAIEQPTNPQEETRFTIADDVTIAETDPTKESERVDSHDVVFSAVSNVRKNLLAMHGNMATEDWIQELNEIAYGLQIPVNLQDFYLKKAVLLYTGMAGIAVNYDTKNIVAEFKNAETIENNVIWTQEPPFDNEAQREIQKVRILNDLKQNYEKRHGKDSWAGAIDQMLVYLDRGGFLNGLKSSAKRMQRDQVTENFGDGKAEAENEDIMRKIRERETESSSG